jgi:hypothetical protein
MLAMGKARHRSVCTAWLHSSENQAPSILPVCVQPKEVRERCTTWLLVAPLLENEMIWMEKSCLLYNFSQCFVLVLGMESRALCMLGCALPLSYTPACFIIFPMGIFLFLFFFSSIS